MTYQTPDSLRDEVNKSTSGYILLFSLTTTLCCIYASVVTTGGNPVSTLGMLAFGGILAAGLGIVGSMGLLSACGVKFVNIVGVIPFLIIGEFFICYCCYYSLSSPFVCLSPITYLITSSGAVFRTVINCDIYENGGFRNIYATRKNQSRNYWRNCL